MIKQTTINKLQDVGTWIVFPSSLRDTPLQMADMENVLEDGTVEHHSLNSLVEEAKGYGLQLVPDTYTINNIEFVAFRYAMYRKEIDLLEQSLEAMGLTNVNIVTNAVDIDFSTFAGNEFFVCSHSEKRLLDELLKTVDEEVVE